MVGGERWATLLGSVRYWDGSVGGAGRRRSGADRALVLFLSLSVFPFPLVLAVLAVRWESVGELLDLLLLTFGCEVWLGELGVRRALAG